jgi:hypothetical protein
MAPLHDPPQIAWLCGILAAGPGWLDRARTALSQRVAPVAFAGPVRPFEFTDYYADQMGSDLLRQLVALDSGAPADDLARTKVLTNQLEAELSAEASHGPDRPVNLDPGYLTLANLVLASCKNFAHRIYLGSGVFAEVTLLFRQGSWQSLDWTFPDYASGLYDETLTEIRNRIDRSGEARP